MNLLHNFFRYFVKNLRLFSFDTLPWYLKVSEFRKHVGQHLIFNLKTYLLKVDFRAKCIFRGGLEC